MVGNRPGLKMPTSVSALQAMTGGSAEPPFIVSEAASGGGLGAVISR
jgi:hypothetical protein